MIFKFVGKLYHNTVLGSFLFQKSNKQKFSYRSRPLDTIRRGKRRRTLPFLKSEYFTSIGGKRLNRRKLCTKIIHPFAVFFLSRIGLCFDPRHKWKWLSPLTHFSPAALMKECRRAKWKSSTPQIYFIFCIASRIDTRKIGRTLDNFMCGCFNFFFSKNAVVRKRCAGERHLRALCVWKLV